MAKQIEVKVNQPVLEKPGIEMIGFFNPYNGEKLQDFRKRMAGEGATHVSLQPPETYYRYRRAH